MSDTQIIIKDLKFYGFHGVYPEEQVVGTTFRVDIIIDVDSDLKGFYSDRLEDTVNYETIIEQVLAIGTGPGFKLIERLVQVMIERIFSLDVRICAVDMTLYKAVNRLTPEPQWIAVRRRIQR